LTEENNQDGQVSEEPPSRTDFIQLLISIAVTSFCVWIIDSYESAQQGYKWAFFGFATLFSGIFVLYSLSNIIEKMVKDRSAYKRRIESLPELFIVSMINGFGLSRLYESFERPDANNDGLFTITDVSINIKETFLVSGNRFTIWIANTDIGQFFEMDKVTASPLLAFIVSFMLWGVLWKTWSDFIMADPITDED
jgi:hypothetical protein